MNHSDWNRPTTAGEVHRRAGGRRAYNARRRLASFFRRRAVFTAYDAGATVAELAAAHSVTVRTIYRDLQRRRVVTRLLV